MGVLGIGRQNVKDTVHLGQGIPAPVEVAGIERAAEPVRAHRVVYIELPRQVVALVPVVLDAHGDRDALGRGHHVAQLSGEEFDPGAEVQFPLFRHERVNADAGRPDERGQFDRAHQPLHVLSGRAGTEIAGGEQAAGLHAQRVRVLAVGPRVGMGGEGHPAAVLESGHLEPVIEFQFDGVQVQMPQARERRLEGLHQHRIPHRAIHGVSPG